MMGQKIINLIDCKRKIKRGISVYLKLTVLLCSLLPGFPILCSAQSFKSEKGYVEFKSSVPLHTFEGKSHHLVGKITMADSTVDFYVDLNTLDTGISKRDRDMRETLDTKKYPFAEFYGKLISPFDLSQKKAQQVSVKGTFKLHGESKLITVDGMITPTQKGLQIEASWMLRLEDYQIEPPGILFYKVNQKQDLHIEALLTPSS